MRLVMRDGRVGCTMGVIVTALLGLARAACNTAMCAKGKYCSASVSLACQQCPVRQVWSAAVTDRAAASPSPAATTKRSEWGSLTRAPRSSRAIRFDAARAPLRCAILVRLVSLLTTPVAPAPTCMYSHPYITYCTCNAARQVLKLRHEFVQLHGV